MQASTGRPIDPSRASFEAMPQEVYRRLKVALRTRGKAAFYVLENGSLSINFEDGSSVEIGAEAWKEQS